MTQGGVSVDGMMRFDDGFFCVDKNWLELLESLYIP